VQTLAYHRATEYPAVSNCADDAIPSCDLRDGEEVVALQHDRCKVQVDCEDLGIGTKLLGFRAVRAFCVRKDGGSTDKRDIDSQLANRNLCLDR